MGKCEIVIKPNGERANIDINGVIDEDFDFTQYVIKDYNEIEVNLAALKSINSCGIREWIKWFNTNPKGTILFYECPKIIIDQINMVQGFLVSNARVMSFFVPYYNEDVGSELNVLFKYGQEFTEDGVKPPQVVKDDQGNLLEMDVVESKYFRFLKKA